jgi:pimeloyl-ACP methyl ester carboxylesterase
MTLTGLADRSHLAIPETSLDTHIDDIVNLITWEDLHDVVLVGHSGGGTPVTGAADRIPERIRRVVYIESGPLPDGTSTFDMNPPEGQEHIKAHLVDGWRYPFPSWEEHRLLGASDQGLDDADKRLISARVTDQPVGPYTQPLRRTGAGDALPKTLISCSFPLDQVKAMIDQGHPFFAALSGPEWELRELPTGHWPMFSRASETADVLASL